MKKHSIVEWPGSLEIIVTVLCLLSDGGAIAQDLRIIGTNLYDFSEIVALSDTDSPYIISGKVQSIEEGNIHLRRVTVDYRFGPRTRIDDSPEGMLLAMAAMKIAQSGVTAGQLASLSPELRQLVMSIKKVEENHDSTLLNYPKGCNVGDSLCVCAIPVAEEDSVFDYGKPVTLASATNCASAYRVRSKSIEAQPFEKFAASLQTDAHKAFIRRCSQAAEGRIYPQFLLGLDYWHGRGTPTNQDLALKWVHTAAAAGSPEAKEFLRTNSPPAK